MCTANCCKYVTLGWRNNRNQEIRREFCKNWGRILLTPNYDYIFKKAIITSENQCVKYFWIRHELVGCKIDNRRPWVKLTKIIRVPSRRIVEHVSTLIPNPTCKQGLYVIIYLFYWRISKGIYLVQHRLSVNRTSTILPVTFVPERYNQIILSGQCHKLVKFSVAVLLVRNVYQGYIKWSYQGYIKWTMLL